MPSPKKPKPKKNPSSRLKRMDVGKMTYIEFAFDWKKDADAFVEFVRANYKIELIEAN